ncbi:MAG: glycosyltransferase family 4 protein [Pseudomonadota bacterium]
MGRLFFASVDTLPRLGGVSMMTHHFANAFARKGHDVVVLGTDEAAIPPGMSADYELVQYERADPGRREGPAWTVIEKPNVLARLSQLWREHRFHHAVALHPYYFGLPLLDLAHRHGAKLSTVFHGYELRSQLLMKARWRAWRLGAANMGPSLSDQTIKLARQSDEVLVNSRYTAKLVQKTGSRAPLRIIGCGLDIREATREIAVSAVGHEHRKRRARVKLGIPPKAPVVGTLGRLVKSKNPDQLIRLLALNPAIYALIAGSGDEHKPLLELAAKLEVLDRLRLVTVADENEKWELLRAMDVFCLLSSEQSGGQVEGFGIVLLEASCAGVPTIAARSGGMVDVVEDRETGLTVPPLNVSALNQAVQNLLEQPETASNYVSASRERVLQQFNYDSIAEEMCFLWSLPQQGRFL